MWHNVIYVIFYSTQFLISKNLDIFLTLAIIFVHNSLCTKFLQNNIMYMYLCVCVCVYNQSFIDLLQVCVCIILVWSTS